MESFLLLDSKDKDEIINYIPNENKLKSMALFFQNFSDVTRLKVISALSINDLCVNDLSKILGINQTTISHQLRYLKNQFIVESSRDGKIVRYSLKNKFINELMNYAIDSINQIHFSI